MERNGTQVFRLTREGILKNSPDNRNLWFNYALKMPMYEMFQDQTLGDYQTADYDNIYVMYTDGNPIDNGEVRLDDPLDLFDEYQPEDFAGFVNVKLGDDKEHSMVMDSDITWGVLDFEGVSQELLADGNDWADIVDDAAAVGIDLSYLDEE